MAHFLPFGWSWALKTYPEEVRHDHVCTKKWACCYYIKSKSQSKALAAVLHEKVCWSLSRNSVPHHKRSKIVLILSIVIGFFHCCDTRSKVYTIHLFQLHFAVAYTCKRFSCQPLSQIAFFWMRSSTMCIPKSCDYNVNVRHVQPPQRVWDIPSLSWMITVTL